MNKVSAIILAAGKGRRMGGLYPKVLTKLKSKTLIDYVVDTVTQLDLEKIVLVVGFMKDEVISHFNRDDIHFAEQKQLLGTADAVRSALPELEGFDGDVMVLCGDVPLIPQKTLKDILAYHRDNKLQATVLSVELDDPARYGRIVRNSDNMLEAIVEAADANDEILKIKEINSGMFVFSIDALRQNINCIDSENAQGEYYLTDIIELLRKKGELIGAFLYKGKPELLFGVNSPEDIKNLEEFLDEV